MVPVFAATIASSPTQLFPIYINPHMPQDDAEEAAIRALGAQHAFLLTDGYLFTNGDREQGISVSVMETQIPLLTVNALNDPICPNIERWFCSIEPEWAFGGHNHMTAGDFAAGVTEAQTCITTCKALQPGRSVIPFMTWGRQHASFYGYFTMIGDSVNADSNLTNLRKILDGLIQGPGTADDIFQNFTAWGLDLYPNNFGPLVAMTLAQQYEAWLEMAEIFKTEIVDRAHIPVWAWLTPHYAEGAGTSVAHDAASESHTGTTGSASEASFSWTHTPVGTPRGVLVFVFTNANADDITSVTYGGVAVPQITEAIDTAGEVGRCTAFFLGTGIPTGAQTVVVTRTNNADVMYAVAVTVTNSVDTDATGAVLVVEDGTLVELNITDGGINNLANAVRYAAINSGLDAVPSPGANSTAVHSIDFGTRCCAVVRETTAGPGNRPVGFADGTSDDRAAIHIAIRTKYLAPQVSGLFRKQLEWAHANCAGTIIYVHPTSPYSMRDSWVNNPLDHTYNEFEDFMRALRPWLPPYNPDFFYDNRAGLYRTVGAWDWKDRVRGVTAASIGTLDPTVRTVGTQQWPEAINGSGTQVFRTAVGQLFNLGGDPPLEHPFSIYFAVAKDTTSGQGFSFLFGENQSATEAGAVAVDLAQSLPDQVTCEHWFENNTNGKRFVNTANDGMHLWCIQYPGNGATSAATRIYKDDMATDISTTSQTPEVVKFASEFGSLYLMNRPTDAGALTASNRLNGAIAGIVGYDADHDLTQRNAVKAALNSRWALGL